MAGQKNQKKGNGTEESEIGTYVAAAKKKAEKLIAEMETIKTAGEKGEKCRAEKSE